MTDLWRRACGWRRGDEGGGGSSIRDGARRPHTNVPERLRSLVFVMMMSDYYEYTRTYRRACMMADPMSGPRAAKARSIPSRDEKARPRAAGGVASATYANAAARKTNASRILSHFTPSTVILH